MTKSVETDLSSVLFKMLYQNWTVNAENFQQYCIPLIPFLNRTANRLSRRATKPPNLAYIYSEARARLKTVSARRKYAKTLFLSFSHRRNRTRLMTARAFIYAWYGGRGTPSFWVAENVIKRHKVLCENIDRLNSEGLCIKTGWEILPLFILQNQPWKQTLSKHY